MSHDKHTNSDRNQDATDGRDKDYYLSLSECWEDPFDEPVVDEIQGRWVVRDDLLEVGSKARFGDLLISTIPREQPIVYVAPRFGYAAISLAFLAKRYGHRLILFMPACKQISDHQMVALEMGAEVIFKRIAAMPNLNKAAKEWAEENDGFFVPLGLKHELVTAAIVKVASGLSDSWGYQPRRVWTAMSTGVLSRGLQIAWPQSDFVGVAVARNIQEGEKGRATVISYPKAFSQNAMTVPPFPCASNYDAKCWDTMIHCDMSEGDLFWNVAGNIKPENPDICFAINSDIPW